MNKITITVTEGEGKKIEVESTVSTGANAICVLNGLEQTHRILMNALNKYAGKKGTPKRMGATVEQIVGDEGVLNDMVLG